MPNQQIKLKRTCVSGLAVVEGMYPSVSPNQKLAQVKPEQIMDKALIRKKIEERRKQKLFKVFVKAFVEKLSELETQQTKKVKRISKPAKDNRLGFAPYGLPPATNNLAKLLQDAGIK